MRLAIALGCLLCAACLGPQTSGGLWAQQNLQRELALGRLSDAQRSAQAEAFERGLASAALAGEQARVTALMDTCPGPTRQPLAVSDGNRLRDAIRLKAHDDAVLLTADGSVAVADWFVRRAAATGDAALCARARQALGDALSPPSPMVARTTRALLDVLGSATVSRTTPDVLHLDVPGPRSRVVTDNADALTTISLYALRFADTVTAPSPLPQYLAAVYGGAIVGRTTPARLAGSAPEEVVDELASVTLQWEPDALYAALASR